MRRYGDADAVINSLLIKGTLHPFLKKMMQIELEDKLWELYLHSFTDKSFGDWKKEVMSNG